MAGFPCPRVGELRADHSPPTPGNILLRAGLPSAFFLASLSHFLPKTFDRVALMAEALEGRYVPAFTGVRAQATDLLSELRARTGL